MAKELVAVLVTDNNGEALYNYTGTGSGQTTFVAESGDLISNSLTINDIKQELTITADKNILSYADNDTATLTTTLTENNNPIQGENIYIYNNPDNIEFDQMLYGTLYYPCIRLKLEGDGVMTFPGGLNINLYDSDNQLIISLSLSTEEYSIISSNGEISLKNITQNYTEDLGSFNQYFILEMGINAQNQTDYPTITSSTFSTFIETITTDSNGVATYTYNSQGVGDVTITAKCMDLQETYAIEDCSFYDGGSSAKVSTHYDTTYATGRTLTYDSTENAYKIVVSTDQTAKTIFVKDLTVSKNVELEYWVKLDSDYSKNTQSRLTLFNQNNNGVCGTLGYWGSSSSQKTVEIGSITPNSAGSRLTQGSYNFSRQTWYRVILRFENGTVTYKVYDTTGTLLDTVTTTTSTFITDANTVGIQSLYHLNATVYFKGLKVKPL